MRSEDIKILIENKRERLNNYYAREKEMLSQSGVKSYAIGSRSLTRYETTLKEVQSAIRTLEAEITELEGRLNGKASRRVLGVIPKDW